MGTRSIFKNVLRINKNIKKRVPLHLEGTRFLSIVPEHDRAAWHPIVIVNGPYVYDGVAYDKG